jgi:hypothetical protein
LQKSKEFDANTERTIILAINFEKAFFEVYVVASCWRPELVGFLGKVTKFGVKTNTHAMSIQASSCVPGLLEPMIFQQLLLYPPQKYQYRFGGTSFNSWHPILRGDNKLPK